MIQEKKISKDTQAIEEKHEVLELQEEQEKVKEGEGLDPEVAPHPAENGGEPEKRHMGIPAVRPTEEVNADRTGRTDMSFKIGSHLSSSGGFMAMAEAMDSIGARTFQYFSRNPRGSRRKAVNPEDIRAFLKFKEERGMGPILAHAPYTMNPAAAVERIRDFADLVFTEDLEFLEEMPGNLYNFHPGSHVGQGVEEGIRWITKSLNRATASTPATKILLETMSGKGTEIGSSFEELADIIQGVNNNEVLGVCLDTCHVHDAGYDIVHDLDGVLEEFDSLIGLEKLHAIHLNDSQNSRGSHKDRHARIGEGHIGLEAFIRIINHPELKDKPFFLETPNELPGYAEEITLLKEHRE